MIEIREILDLDRSSNCEHTISVGLTMQEVAQLKRKIAETTKSLRLPFPRLPFQKLILSLVRFQLVKFQPYISGALPQFDDVTSISKLPCICTNFRAKVVFNKLIKFRVLVSNW